MFKQKRDSFLIGQTGSTLRDLLGEHRRGIQEKNQTNPGEHRQGIEKKRTDPSESILTCLTISGVGTCRIFVELLRK